MKSFNRTQVIKKEKCLNEFMSKFFSFQWRLCIFSKFTGSGGSIFDADVR